MSSKGAVGFAQFYTTMYGARWPAIKAALLADKQHVAVINPHSRYVPDTQSSHLADISFAHILATHHPAPQPTDSGLTNYYLLDAASILAVEALNINPGECVVDLCAAPGGKSLLCALKLDGRGQLIANDRSSNRRQRITRILNDYLPPAHQAIVTVTGHDAMTWSQHQVNYFDKVLLDAPCSSERHVLNDAHELATWAQGRSKSLAIQQFAMLASALEIVRVGGRIVYSTCALSHFENDEVIRKLHKKRAGQFIIHRPTFGFGEPTEYGWQVLPDTSGWGPFYLAVIERTADGLDHAHGE
jgi:16S rRNA C967 or C1407 C5-methylase (RsmB/RsmF family)